MTSPSFPSGLWTTTAEDAEPHPSVSAPLHDVFAAEASVSGKKTYYPLTDTLRLYAGWLLAWYVLLYVLGGYQMTKQLPFRFALLDDFVASPVIASFSFALFLFLFLTSLHRALRGTVLLGTLLSLLGMIAFLLFAVNIG